MKYERKIAEYDSNFTGSAFIIYWKMNERKQLRIFIDLMKKILRI